MSRTPAVRSLPSPVRGCPGGQRPAESEGERGQRPAESEGERGQRPAESEGERGQRPAESEDSARPRARARG
ncbi:hypothetical protein ACIOEX_12490 [Streptomyces sp. NPDC087850]|uniref:hypothetical protein n=1 Tax=Streptomyces sp. NPDC087850 TaxID=3365809 RepID=UPI003824199A